MRDKHFFDSCKSTLRKGILCALWGFYGLESGATTYASQEETHVRKETEQRPFANDDSLPAYRTIRPGFNIEVKCLFCKTEVWVPAGFTPGDYCKNPNLARHGEFPFPVYFFYLTCTNPSCESYVSCHDDKKENKYIFNTSANPSVSRFGFWKCTYAWWYIDNLGEGQPNEMTRTAKAGNSFDEYVGPMKWCHLLAVKVKPLPS